MQLLGVETLKHFSLSVWQPSMFQCLINEAPFIWTALSSVWELNKSRKKLSGIGKVKAKSPTHRTSYGCKKQTSRSSAEPKSAAAIKRQGGL